jgi:hypothetical protein
MSVQGVEVLSVFLIYNVQVSNNGDTGTARHPVFKTVSVILRVLRRLNSGTDAALCTTRYPRVDLNSPKQSGVLMHTGAIAIKFKVQATLVSI